MSSWQYFPGSRASGKAPEKSSFAQTSNLLSQFLKEKCSVRDLNLGITEKLEATGRSEISRSIQTTVVDLLPNIEKSSQMSTEPIKSVDLRPGVAGSSAIENVTNKSFRKAETMEPKTAQMTMFYEGQVLVFDNFLADEAKEVLLLAGKGSSPTTTSFVSKISSADKIKSASNPTQELVQPQPEAVTSDMPIARRASLHRFLEKRKGRAIAAAPYQVHSPSPASPKHDEQLELKL